MNATREGNILEACIPLIFTKHILIIFLVKLPNSNFGHMHNTPFFYIKPIVFKGRGRLI
jgi:hypothetical protein